MGSQQEAVVRSSFDCFAADDVAALVDHYSDDAVFYFAAWHKPLVVRGGALYRALDSAP
jgi:ketosteroid isomerase-like protein